MQRLFGWSSTPKPDEDATTTTKALPASWYTSSDMFELERRAIFSKKWLLVTHQQRLVNIGDFVRTTAAGYPIVIVRDRQRKIRAHHNVCRHRAYPVVEEKAGNVSIFACKYHSWSYGLDGKLAKAPRYQDLEGFDKSANGLFGVHVHVDRMGFVWINLDTKTTPEIAWEDDLGKVDVQERLRRFDASKYHFDHQYEVVGDFNWKTLADNYNECYHCPTGHPALNATANFGQYYVKTDGPVTEHWNADKDNGQGMCIGTTFCYPAQHFTISDSFLYIGRWIPLSSGQTRMEYEVYKSNDPSRAEDFTRLNDIFKVVLSEDKDLCNAAYRNVQLGVFNAGELHPQTEKGPLHFQQITRELVKNHHAAEEAAKTKIRPALPTHVQSEQSQDDIMFCDGLSAMGSKLSW